jgi:hypothetical protein
MLHRIFEHKCKACPYNCSPGRSVCSGRYLQLRSRLPHARQRTEYHRGIAKQRMYLLFPHLLFWESILQCCGSRMFIPDPNFFHPGSRIRIFTSRIRIKEFKYFNPKKLFQSTRKYHLGFSSRIRILSFYPSRNPNSGIKKAPDPGSGSATVFFWGK